ncbi:MAG: hypothetical protein ACQGVC_03485 [Myxococcota bacterium]
MDSFTVIALMGAAAVAIGQTVVRRTRNPSAEVPYGQLPVDLREEVERVLPGFVPRLARLTKQRDEARVEGGIGGATFRVEADFDRQGQLVEFEAETRCARRRLGMASADDLPEPAAREIERVLGESASGFRRRSVSHGKAGDEPYYEVEGRDDTWKWEIVVTASGRLLELEKERRRKR